ncbi:peptidoglycan DD-metalloendopeptidase family protein [Streptomyces wuyuanensis]|uniref:peptidoglycan DD-metalloendopeptidase family protein n=1 Tax=Streptomyces wuyuanensis TaxID=1196353 RepID=UPI003803215A
MIRADTGGRETVGVMNRGRRVVTTALVAALLVLVCPVAARAAVWPVGPPRPAVVRGWEPPPSPYGRGHRGVDLTAPPGTEVRAAAAGRVSFAGPVAGRGVLSIELAGTGDPPLRTTYEPVRPLVAEGALVGEGEAVAVIAEGPAHCPRGCLHWGLRRGTEYLDPLSLLPASALRRGPSRLLPVFGVPRSAEAPGPAAQRLADTAAAPSRAGADAVQALILVAAAVLSRRALRHRREGVVRGSGRRRAVCGGAWRRTPALMGRRWAARAGAWRPRDEGTGGPGTTEPHAARAEPRAGARAAGGGGGKRGARGAGSRRGRSRHDMARHRTAEREDGARAARRGCAPRADPAQQSQTQGGGRVLPGVRRGSERDSWARATPGAGHARAPGRRGAVSRQGHWTRHRNGPTAGAPGTGVPDATWPGTGRRTSTPGREPEASGGAAGAAGGRRAQPGRAAGHGGEVAAPGRDGSAPQSRARVEPDGTVGLTPGQRRTLHIRAARRIPSPSQGRPWLRTADAWHGARVGPRAVGAGSWWG